MISLALLGPSKMILKLAAWVAKEEVVVVLDCYDTASVYDRMLNQRGQTLGQSYPPVSLEGGPHSRVVPNFRSIVSHGPWLARWTGAD